jgi:hypothetical protein
VLSITDDEFLEMQRRFPKWALPAAIGGATLLVGLVGYAILSGDEAPPLPVAPVLTPGPMPSGGREGRLPQPDLNAIPLATSEAKGSDEKDFGKAFAQAANKGTGNFDAKAAERSASAALERATKCRVGTESAGQIRVEVTIAPSGQVTFVQVGSPHATSATGKCIDKALRGFTTKPFLGEAAKLPLTITLR